MRALQHVGPVLLAVCLCAATAWAGDGFIDWDHVSHLPRFDRTPVCPVDSLPFTVRLCTAPGDLDGVRVRVVDGSDTWVDAVRTSGAHRDEWNADLPASARSPMHYYFELRDGSALGYLGPAGALTSPPADSGWTMDFVTLAHAPRGATPLDGGGAVFRVWAPSNSGAIAQGEFNGWASAVLIPKVGGDFIVRQPTAHAGQQYKYQFSNGWWEPDPWGAGLQDDGYGGLNSVVESGAFAWQDAGFVPPGRDHMVIYALYPQEFAGYDDPLGSPPYPAGFADVTARIAHLKELGVNTVQLAPVSATSMIYPYGGYQPLSQWAVNASLGGSTSLCQLVQALHANGIAVLFDLVWSHQAFSDDFLWGYGGFQSWYSTPPAYANYGPQLNYTSPDVHDYLVESAVRWVEEFHADGLRFYSVPEIANGLQAASGSTLLRDAQALLERRGHGGLMLADVIQRDGSVTAARTEGGLGFGAQADYQFASTLTSALQQTAGGDPYVTGLAGAMLGGGPGLGTGSFYRFLEMPHEAWSYAGRPAALLEHGTTLDDPDLQSRMRLSLGLVMTAPGIPGMLMGDEWLEDIALYDSPDGRIDWEKKTIYRPFFDYVSRAVALRAGEDGLGAGAAIDVVHLDETANVLVFRRHQAGHEVLVAANLGNADQPSCRVGASVQGVWRERLNSADPLWGGAGPLNPGNLHTQTVPADGQAQSLLVALPRLSLTVLSPIGTLGAPDAPVAVTRFGLSRISPNPVADLAMADVSLPRAGVVRLELFDVSGRRLGRVAEVALGPGEHRVPWRASDLHLAPGLYVLTAESAGERAMRKVAVLR